MSNLEEQEGRIRCSRATHGGARSNDTLIGLNTDRVGGLVSTLMDSGDFLYVQPRDSDGPDQPGHRRGIDQSKPSPGASRQAPRTMPEHRKSALGGPDEGHQGCRREQLRFWRRLPIEELDPVAIARLSGREPTMTAREILLGSGRVGRLHFFLYKLGLLAVLAVPVLTTTKTDPITGANEFSLATNAIFAAVAWLGFMNVRRRVHDTNASILIYPALFFPLINIAAGLYLLFEKGDPEENQHGSPPGGTQPSTVVTGPVSALAPPG